MTQTQKEARPQARWQGSLKTALIVRSQIAERWGEEEADKYDPEVNCFTFNTWRAKGYRVKKGEKALRSFTLIHKGGESDDNGENGAAQESGSTYPKSVCLFYVLQVEKREEK